MNTSQFDIVVLASSAGGIKALIEVLTPLPKDFSASVVVVQHQSAHYHSWLMEILERRIQLKVKDAQEGDKLQTGKVYLAPTDSHLLVNEDRTLSLSQGAKVNFVRPSADILFESVAQAYQQRAIAVVLTGTGKDGAEGIQSIHRWGGRVIAQDADAEFFSMPETAISTGGVDWILPLSEISPTLITLVMANQS